ncbi:MAG: TlyA family RNA methyltransferase [Clostridia bacterium]|nr:TlyA family RNA methyltransferase [Clostridia bacterium]
MRLDVLLAGRGLYASRSKAGEAIKMGLVAVNGETVKKPSYEADGSEEITARAAWKYVSRAGEKLEAAFRAFGADCKGLCALDIGASTGGFTECLLEHGAAYVYALDVGKGQLDEKLKNDARVVPVEETNARYLQKSDFPREIEFITMDVSFISQTLIYPACARLLAPGGIMITLVKPQFEAGKENVGKGGIVKDRDGRIIKEILARVDLAAEENGFAREGLIRSPIEGGDGNTEYLAIFKKVRER